MDLSDHVESFLKRHALAGKTGVVAISGGPDSVALARTLAFLVERQIVPHLILAHLNHQLRGAESDSDEAFVQSLPNQWRLEHLSVRSERIAVRQRADEKGNNLEAEARDARYTWLRRIAQSERAGWIATGHTLDDQAETVLFRLLRGTGISGLAGIAPLRSHEAEPPIIRPFLDVRRGQLLDFLSGLDQKFQVDSSNVEIRFQRNRIRHTLLPMLEREFSPQLSNHLAHLADQAREWGEEIEHVGMTLLTVAELPPADTVRVLRLESLRSASDVAVIEMFRQLWRRESWPLREMGHVEWRRLLDLARGNGNAADFPGKIYARRVGSVLQLHPGPRTR